MNASDLMQAMADAGAPLEAIILAVRALDAKDAEIRERDQAAADKRAIDAARKREERAAKASKDSPRTRAGRVQAAPPNDIYSNPPEPSGAEAPAIPFSEKVVSVWKEVAVPSGLAPARPLNVDRRKHLAARVKEHGEPAVLEAIAKLAASDWHCGRGGSTWKANLGWLLKSPENFQKILERDGPANGAPRQAMTTEAQQAYLATLESDTKPWMRRSEITPPAPRKGNTSPPRPIGDLITNIAGAAR